MATDQTSDKSAEPSSHIEPVSPVEHSHPAQDCSTTQQQTKQKENKTFWLWRRKTLIASQLLFNLVLIGIYGFQVYFMQEQWNTMEAQLAEMRNSSADTRAVAEATQSQAQTSRLDQRAWLYAHATSSEPEVGKTMRLAIHTVNTGKTFARNFKLCHLIAHTYNSPPKDPIDTPQFSECSEKDWTAPNVIAPYSTWTHEGFGPDPKGSDGLNSDQAEWIAAGKVIVWQYGKITYKDIFDVDHWVRFCFYRIVSVGLPRFVTCNVGNDIDQNK